MVIDLLRWCVGGVVHVLYADWRAHRGTITAVEGLANGQAALVWVKDVMGQEFAHDSWRRDIDTKCFLIENIERAAVFDSWHLKAVLVVPEPSDTNGPEEIVLAVFYAPNSPVFPPR